MNKMPYSDEKGRIDIEVRMHDGVNRTGTAYGSIRRKPKMGTTYRASVGGEHLVVHDPYGYAHVYVTKFPRDIDTQGYE